MIVTSLNNGMVISGLNRDIHHFTGMGGPNQTDHIFQWWRCEWFSEYILSHVYTDGNESLCYGLGEEMCPDQ